MFLTLVRLYPHRDKQDAVRRFLAGILGPTRVQPGCLGCTLATESDPDALLYMEIWESEADLLKHLQSDGYAKVLATMELSTMEPDVCIYEITNHRGLEWIEHLRMGNHEGWGAE
jgi:quinol monooxygenase YgiN